MNCDSMKRAGAGGDLDMHTRQTDEPGPQEPVERPDRYDSYHRYFTEFLPGIIGQLMMENLKDLSCQAEILVTDSGDAPWRLGIEQGRLMHVDQEGPDPECRYVLDIDTLIDIVTAQCSPQDAFFEMRIEIEGDIERGLELSAVLEIFFKTFPYEVS